MLKDENKCLWMLKGIACITVILFHCPIQGFIGDGIIYALRFPIPIFLMISGYYSFSKKSYLKSALKTLRLLIFGELITATTIWISFLTDMSNTNPLEIISQTNFIKVIFFGTVFNGTLWYLYAMFWGWLLFYIASKNTYGFFILKCSIIPLLLTHIFVRMFVTKYYDINKQVFLFRSTILFVIPFFMIGRLIAEHQHVILQKLSGIKSLILIFNGMFLTIIEYVVWKQFMDLQISTIFISIGLFIFSLQHPKFAPSKLLTQIGYMSSYVYLFHIPVIILLKPILLKSFSDTVTTNIMPYLVITITISISYIYTKITKKIK